jgi:CheY-like chemotaxis protein
MQQERLRALGEMASGIAHDINNAISPVALYTELLIADEPNLSARARDYLEITQRAVSDVAETVARMKEFYRQQESQPKLTRVDVNRLMRQVVDLTRARWSDMPQQRGVVIRLETDLAQETLTVLGVESELREALTNLVFNAVDAMPEGGTLTLTTGEVAQPRGAGDASPQAVRLEVSDTGVGMDPETKRRCFEPFFTTKGERGTGLGLAMVYGIVQRHSGDIELDSPPGGGTTVRIVLPAPVEANDDTVNLVAPRRRPTRLRILAVDDDPLVLRALCRALETDGHAVVAVHGGQEGIDAFRAALERNEPFAAVITDLGMPYVDGRKLAGAVKTVSPETPVILLTGWGQRLAAEGGAPAHVDYLLGKPPKLSELRAALAEVTRPADPAA